jgi:hypothetical protein
MKLLRIFLLLAFLGIFAAYQEGRENNKKSLIETNSYQNVPLETNSRINSGSLYRIQAKLIPETKTLEVKELITWTNLTEYPADRICFNLRANSFKNDKSEYAKSAAFPEESRTQFIIEETLVDGRPVKLEYNSASLNKFDSTTASVPLAKEANPGSVVQISFKYKIPIPRAFDGIGYAGGRNFFFFSDWYPRIAEFKDGRWICLPRKAQERSSFGFDDYHVEITAPETYNIAGAGITYNAGVENTVTFEAHDINSFAWFASDNMIPFKREYKTASGRRIALKAYVQPENEKYIERYFSAMNYSLEFMEKNIDEYPYSTLTLADQPRTSFPETMEFPSLITVRPELFSPVQTYYPEFTIVYGTVSQYFDKAIKTKGPNSAWMGSGLSLYLTEKIMETNYGKRQASFKLFGHYPIFGLNFLSYNEIPLIYTLGDFEIPVGTASLFRYYKDPGLSAISDTVFADNYSRDNELYFKPELMLISLERTIGWKRLSGALKNYYGEFKFSEARPNDLIQSIKQSSPINLNPFFEEVYDKAVIFDYKITGISKGESGDTYVVRIRRKGEGIFRQEVLFYTDKDTLRAEWDGASKWTDITFTTKNTPAGAEIDPKRKNILDINYADNSYIINGQYAGSISLSLQYFFWMQNLLLILGSVG